MSGQKDIDELVNWINDDSKVLTKKQKKKMNENTSKQSNKKDKKISKEMKDKLNKYSREINPFIRNLWLNVFSFKTISKYVKRRKRI